jgi:PAS domain-containing protein
MNKIDDRLPFGNPITIVVIYVMISIVLIIFSDVVLSTIAKDVPTLTMLQSFKGMIYIIINAIIIYILVNRGFRSISESNEYIKENERKHNIILDTVGDIIVYVDKYGKIIDVNKRVEIKLGYKKVELLGKSFIDVGILDV